MKGPHRVPPSFLGRTLLGHALLAAALLLPVAAVAQPASVSVDHVWSRAAMAGSTGVVYLTITATGAPDTLLGAASPVAAKAELHESFDDNGVMKMRPVASLPVVPGKPVKLQPGGYHIMLIDLTHALTAGERFPITLTIRKGRGGHRPVSVRRRAPSDMPMSPGGTGKDGMPGMKM